MNRSTIHHRTLRASAATAGAALALSGAALALAPTASADGTPGDGVPKMTLSVDAPARIGLAGGPVEFTETIGNTGTGYVPDILELEAAAGAGMPSDGLSIDYRAADGSWKPVELTFAGGVFSGRPSRPSPYRRAPPGPSTCGSACRWAPRTTVTATAAPSPSP